MRKLLTAIISLSLLTVPLTGCTGGGSSSSGSGASGASDASGTSSDDSSGSSSGGESGSDSSSSGSGGVGSGSGSGSESGSDNAGESGGSGEAGGENLPDPNGRAAMLGKAASEAVEWPSMMDVTDPEMAQNFFGIDLGMVEDYYLANQLISAQLNEIIFVKPSEGNEDAVKTAIDEHFEYIRNEAAFYPEQEASAAGAVTGVTPDGYYYIIVHENGDDAAQAALAAE